MPSASSTTTTTPAVETGPGVTLTNPKVIGRDKAGAFGAENVDKAVALAAQLSTAGWMGATAGGPGSKDRFAMYATAAANKAYNDTLGQDGPGLAYYGLSDSSPHPWPGENDRVSNYVVTVIGPVKDKATGATAIRLKGEWDHDLDLAKPAPGTTAKVGHYRKHQVDIIDVVMQDGQAKASSFLNEKSDSGVYTQKP